MGIFSRLRKIAATPFRRRKKEPATTPEPLPELQTDTQPSLKTTSPGRIVEIPVPKTRGLATSFPRAKEPLKADQQQKGVIQNIRRKGDIKTITGGIRDEGRNQVQIINAQPDLETVYGTYKGLLGNNAKITDPQILDILIDNREKLRDRFFAVIHIRDINGEPQAEVRLFGALLEEVNTIFQFIKGGEYIDSPTMLWNILQAYTGNLNKKFGTAYSREENITVTSSGRVTLAPPIINYSFA